MSFSQWPGRGVCRRPEITVPFRQHEEQEETHETETETAGALLAPAMALASAQVAAQDIKVGVTVSATGPAASLGIPERNTFALMPQSIGGRKVPVHHPRRRLRHHQRGEEHAQADRRGQGRRHHRLDRDAELAGDDRRRRRDRDADDLDGRLQPHRRAGRRQEALGVQDAAERPADGGG